MLCFSDKWYQYVINNCDCSGIENLIVSNPRYNENDNSWDDEDYVDVELQTFVQLALKFPNLKRLKLHFGLVLFCDLLSFWTFLKPIINKTNSKVESISYAWKKLMTIMIVDNGTTKIDTMKFYLTCQNQVYEHQFENIKSILSIISSNLNIFQIIYSPQNCDSVVFSSIIKHYLSISFICEAIFKIYQLDQVIYTIVAIILY